MDFFGIEHDQTATAKEQEKAKNVASSANLIDEQYFGNVDSTQHTSVNDPKHNYTAVKKPAMDQQCFDTANDDRDFTTRTKSTRAEASGVQVDETNNFIDQVYFGDGLKRGTGRSRTNTPNLTEPATAEVSDVPFDEADNFIDQTYFGNAAPERTGSSTRTASLSGRRRTRVKPDADHRSSSPDRMVHQDSPVDPSPKRVGDVAEEIRQRARINLWTGGSLDSSAKTKPDHAKEKLDSMGYRVPDDDQFHFDYLTENEAAHVLSKTVIDIRDNILVLNKPHGIASHPGPGLKYNIAELLPRVRHILKHQLAKTESDESDYFVVHRLDKDSTGLVLIARNRDASLRLQEAFAKRWIKKDYLCITVGIPHSNKGYLDVPIVRRSFAGTYKMCISPLNRNVQSNVGEKPVATDLVSVEGSDEDEDVWSRLDPEHVSSSAPITRYEMLDRSNDAALLLCSALSGVKHQVRVHVAMGLGTPILGDHKYSHAAYLAPQRLPHRLLERLEIRQTKVRHLLLHLHACQLQFRASTDGSSSRSVQPGFFDFVRARRGGQVQAGRTLIAPPPAFFMNNLKRIGLKLPRYLARLCVR